MRARFCALFDVQFFAELVSRKFGRSKKVKLGQNEVVSPVNIVVIIRLKAEGNQRSRFLIFLILQ